MAFFNKKKEETKNCCSADNFDAKKMIHSQTENSPGASVKVLGSGCAKCNRLEAATKEALAQLGMDTSIDHVTDYIAIASYGVMSTPALVVDQVVKSSGKLLSVEEIIDLLKGK